MASHGVPHACAMHAKGGDADTAATGGEPRARVGWARMAVYWAGSATLFWRRYYGGAQVVKMVLLGAGGRPGFALAAAGVTSSLLTHLKYASRTMTRGRACSLPASLLFGVGNGVNETLAFLASFDVGRRLAERLNAPAIVSFSAGFITHSMYSALIHARFWLPHALPPHVRADAKPFTSDALPVRCAPARVSRQVREALPIYYALTVRLRLSPQHLRSCARVHTEVPDHALGGVDGYVLRLRGSAECGLAARGLEHWRRTRYGPAAAVGGRERVRTPRSTSACLCAPHDDVAGRINYLQSAG